MVNVNIKYLTSTAKTPMRGSFDAAGYDLYADFGDVDFIEIEPHQNKTIDTGISVAIPQGYFGAIFARSGLARKENLRPANAVGVIDADYRGMVKVVLHNDSDLPRFIQPGERIAQLVVLPFEEINFEEVEELPSTSRGSGGFGSTGVK